MVHPQALAFLKRGRGQHVVTLTSERLGDIVEHSKLRVDEKYPVSDRNRGLLRRTSHHCFFLQAIFPEIPH